MAKFVIAGSCDCPYFAKLELLAHQLSTNLPHFEVHKISLPTDEWPSWLLQTCEKNKWKHEKSPIVWRELVERGGKGFLLGGFNEFCEYAKRYYDVESSMMTSLMLSIKEENVVSCINNREEEKEFRDLCKPIHICIVNAISPVAYHLIPHIASGDVFGSDVEISIRLLDSPSNVEQLEGVVMETQDLAFPLLRQICICTDATVAMRSASVVIILEDDDAPEEDGSRREFLLNNAERFQTYGRVLDSVALPNVKVIVAGNAPINFSTFILLETVKNVEKENIVASSRLQDRRARAILSRWLKVNSDDIKDTVILGNCSNNGPEKSSLVAISPSKVHNYDGAIWGPSWYSRPLNELVYDRDWLATDFISIHRDHDTDLTKSLKHSAAMSEGASLASVLKDWINGGDGETISSLGIHCSGCYGISDCVFSLPVCFVGGGYQLAQLEFDDVTKEAMKTMTLYLKKDLQVAFPSRFEELKPVFGEDSNLISSSLVDHSGKVVSGLSVIQEDVAAESQSIGEAIPEEVDSQKSISPVEDAKDAGADEANAGADEANAGADEANAGADEANAGADEANAGADEANAGADEANAGLTDPEEAASEIKNLDNIADDQPKSEEMSDAQ